MGDPKIYRVQKPHPMWLVSFWVAGKRLRRHFAEKTKAEEQAREWKQLYAVEGAAGVQLDAVARAEFFGAKRLLGAVPIATAVAFYLQHHPAAGAVLPASEAQARYLEACRLRNLALKTRLTIEERTDAFLRHSGLASTAELTTERIRSWLAREGVSARTRVNDRAVLQRWCRWLVREKVLGADPVGEIERPQVDWKAPTILTPLQAAALMRAAETTAGGQLVVYYALALFAGLRPGEIARLRWDQVKLAGREPVIRIEAGKRRGGRAARVVPVTKALAVWLRPRIGTVMAPANLRWPTVQVRRAAGIVTRDARGRTSGWEQDACRHSYISYRLAIIHDEARVAREVGNSPDVIYRHYHATSTRAEARAFFGVLPTPR